MNISRCITLMLIMLLLVGCKDTESKEKYITITNTYSTDNVNCRVGNYP